MTIIVTIRLFQRRYDDQHNPGLTSYIVSTEECYIVDNRTDSNEPIEEVEFQHCFHGEPLTEVKEEIIEKKLKHKLIVLPTRLPNEPFWCCYQEKLYHIEYARRSDFWTSVKYLDSKEGAVLHPLVEFVYTECFIQEKMIYNEIHNIFRNRGNSIFVNNTKPGVLVLSINDIPKSKFSSMMPKTSWFLEEDIVKWFPLNGYTKMNYNSFSIIMSMLSGWSEKDVFRICRPYSNFIDMHCPLIFQNFKSHGYFTAYGEDLNEQSTFYNIKRGFKYQITDFNLLPAIKKAYKNMSRKNTCLGNRHEFEYVLDYASDFAKKFINLPSFAFFRIGSLNQSTSRLIDKGVFNFLTKAKIDDLFKNNIVFLTSDLKGNRDLLPIMYVRLPHFFEKKFPKLVRNLNKNMNSLISPYDIHMTLKHILKLSNPSIKPSDSTGCPSCKSIFQEIPKTRGCKSIGVQEEFCPCEVLYQQLDVNSELAFEIALKVIAYINQEIDKYNIFNQHQDYICLFNKLKEIVKVSYNKKDNWFNIILTTFPADSRIEAVVDRKLMSVNHIYGQVLC
ncbi:hypothetical protein ACFFRR_011844 [Megaselia abdita]